MSNDFKKEKEMEVLLKEYETLRAEIGQNLGAQIQLINIALLLTGGLIALAPFLLSLNSHGLQLAIPLLYFVIVLLVISLLFTSFAWAYLLLQFALGRIGTYTNQFIITRVCKLLEMESPCGVCAGFLQEEEGGDRIGSQENLSHEEESQSHAGRQKSAVGATSP